MIGSRPGACLNRREAEKVAASLLLFIITVTNLGSPQRRRGHEEESLCPFTGDPSSPVRQAQGYGGTSTVNGQVARPPSAEVDRCRLMAPLLHKGVHSSDRLIQTLLPQTESHLSFAGIPACRVAGIPACSVADISRQMKDLTFSVSSVLQW
jgi:hypothetical protein